MRAAVQTVKTCTAASSTKRWKRVLSSVQQRGTWLDNDGLSGMGSSSFSITVGATDDKNTIDQ